MKNAVAICPDLVPPELRTHGTYKDLQVIEHGWWVARYLPSSRTLNLPRSGLRPARTNGIRIERDLIGMRFVRRSAQDVEIILIDQVPVIHNYGHAGAGRFMVGCCKVTFGL